ncbi:MAG: beta-ketoacyl-[acyl-carrier-protein] synthase family protein [Butyricicoccus sp.]|nr:beta-ketoacyl-[acyl-carrier-protein] synthase family protein [Butyricicoccus sp.]
MAAKIVITGMGAVTPVGICVENYWDALLRGDCGVGEIDGTAERKMLVTRAAQVKGFNSRDWLNSRLAADLDLFMQYAYVAAEQALADSGLESRSWRCGVVMGTALAGLALAGRTQQEFAESGKQVTPRFLSRYMGNIAAAQFAISHGIKGPSMTVSTACSSGGDALVLASMLLRSGEADSIVVMAGESAISPLVINGLCKAGALSKNGESRPFDRNRNGFVVGEGGGALVLEIERHAVKRGAKIYAELVSCANNTDAYHTVTPEPSGAGAAECMRHALSLAELEPSDIGYVNAHGTATAAGDLAETHAIHSVFHQYEVPVSSTKGATGHLMGAGGITETIACVKAIQTGTLPFNIGFETPDPRCDLNIIAGEPLQKEIKWAMSNSLGFGGQNSCVITGRYDG